MSDRHDTTGEQLPAASVSGTAFLVLIQVISRGLTFISNQAILHNISPEILGAAAQLELYSLTVLYFSREFIRTAIQRQPSSIVREKSQTEDVTEQPLESAGVAQHGVDTIASQTIINMSYLSVAFGVPLATILGASYLRFSTDQIIDIPYFRIGLKIVCISCLFELATEPFFAIVQQRLLYKTRAIVETGAAVSRSVAITSTSIWAVRTGKQIGILPFAFGHIAYAVALLCGYLWIMAHKHNFGFSFLLKPIKAKAGAPYLVKGLFSRDLMSLGANVYLQLIVKHLLTQGDSIILAAFSSLEDQGIYSLVSNYGGLLARVVFQPLEESSRNLFAQLVNSNGKREEQRRGISAAKGHLARILRLYGIMSTLAFVIGPTVVPEILGAVMGSQWIKVKSLLGVYCYYIPFLAFNGITEAFVASTANSAEIRMQAAWMAVFSTCYAVMCFIFLHIGGLGAYGLVLANIVNMFVRTLWSYAFIKRFLHRQGSDLQLSEVSPRLATFGSCVIAISVLSTTKGSADDGTGKVKIFGVALVCSLLVLSAERRYLITQGQEIFRQIRTGG